MPLETNPDRPRFDAIEKVTGKPLFAADRQVRGVLHARLVPATIAKGDIEAIDTSAAEAVAGVIRVLTWRDFGDIKETPALIGGGGQQPGYQPMKRPSVRHRGEPVAMVVAETLEAAVEGAEAVRVRYRPAPFTARYDLPGAEREPAQTDEEAGDAEAAFKAAARTIDVRYLHPQQYHNPIEMLSTTVDFVDGKIIVMEGSQNSGGIKTGLAAMLGIEPNSIEVSSPYIGGGFGQKNGVQQHTALVVRAAMLMARPIKLVMPRDQLFHTTRHRPLSTHRTRIGATPAGRMEAVLYDTEQENSRYDQYGGAHGEHPSRMYATPNWRSTHCRIRIDTQPVAHQRAPHEHPASYGTECAYDELAFELGVDPVALRLMNDTQTDPITGGGYTSRRLAECLRRGAARFGWDRWTPETRARKAANGDLIGFGVAAGAYSASGGRVAARLRLNADGSAHIAVGGHEMGQGMRSAIAAEVINVLQVDPNKLTVEVGETSGVQQAMTVGSRGCSSAAPSARAVALRMREQLAELVGPENASGPAHVVLARAKRPFLTAELAAPGGNPRGGGAGAPPGGGQARPSGVAPPSGHDAGGPGGARPEAPEPSAFSWIAHFAEVHVDPNLGRVRVQRVVSVADCGRVMNHRAAASQVRGGVVWGIGAALCEIGEVDPRYGRVLNNDLADYILPVNADVGDIEVELLDLPDTSLNISGVKGVGEVAIVGSTAAIVNAVYHATGKRVRHLPIRIEDLI
ncbi:xanthine dehydrogenase family protein molybdopterin-binding subunit [Sphingomonas sp. DT-207]|uniref:xanthine dehydrogenase family protein molybdopterin-binding subunit n=1 Tax=Sphingomonas sp. DT-207 TaxID=3396167 RepID=UPI003F1B23BD